MRLHVAWHILKGHLIMRPDLCGFCGEGGCRLELRPGSGDGVNKTLKVWSDCPYFHCFNFKSSYDKVIRSYPCSNRPIACEICKGIYWSYNIQVHYELSHNNCQIPDLITKQEREAVLKMF